MAAIELQSVSKRYRIYPRNIERFKEAVSFGRLGRGRDFWALRDVSLKVEPGESLGLVGRNGAGKSTMLQIVSGVLQPTSGMVSVRGRISALLQLGAGFNNEFTGRENAIMNGLLLGIDRQEMIQRFDEIESFADLGDFMDQPVKRYSSGMRARLGFAVAVNVDPEILLVDETLSVGDGVFRHTGIRKMRELQESGATVIFVSHSHSMIKSFCTEAALLHEGNLIAHGGTSEIVDEYHALLAEASEKEGVTLSSEEDDDDQSVREIQSARNRYRYGTGEAKIQGVEVLDHNGNSSESTDPESPITIRLHAFFNAEVKDGSFKIVLRNKTGLDVFSTGTRPERVTVGKLDTGDKVIVDFTFVPTLHSGPYSISAGVFSRNGNQSSTLDWMDIAATFEIGRASGRSAFEGIVHLPTNISVNQSKRSSISGREI